MTFDAVSRGLGGGSARFFLSTLVLVLGLAAAQEAMQPPGESPPPDAPVVTLRSLITGTCQEIHRYAESVVGTGVLRSVAEVLLVPSFCLLPVFPHCPLLIDGLLADLTSLFALSLSLINAKTII